VLRYTALSGLRKYNTRRKIIVIFENNSALKGQHLTGMGAAHLNSINLISTAL